ncbi:MAG: hypothetical protein AAB110_07595 [Candidatus Desantisbacteria bacterium]
MTTENTKGNEICGVEGHRSRKCSRQVGAGLAPALSPCTKIDLAENGGMVQGQKSGAMDARYGVQGGHRIFPRPLWERVIVSPYRSLTDYGKETDNHKAA